MHPILSISSYDIMSTNKVIVGTPSLCLDGWTRTEICFHGFADLTTTRDEEVESPLFSCFGHQWKADLFPGGDEGSDDGFISIYLCNMSNKPIKIQYGYSIKDADGKEVVHRTKTNKFGGADYGEGDVGNCWGTQNFCSRSTIMDALIEGTLIFEFRLKLSEASTLSSQFIPKNPLNKNILNKFNDDQLMLNLRWAVGARKGEIIERGQRQQLISMPIV